MAQRNWNRDELLLAMNLYCRLPFGKMHKGNPEIIALAEAIGRTPSSVAMKLVNLASLDPAERARGIAGLSKASAADRAIWDEFHADWETAAYESETLYRRALRRQPNVPAALGSETRDKESVPHHVGLTPRRSPSSPISNQQLAISNLPTDEAIALRSEQATDAERSVRVRTAQDFFRRAVLASYRATCCISGIALPELLVASHILPWSSPASRAAPASRRALAPGANDVSSSPRPGTPGRGAGGEGPSSHHRVDPRNGLCLSRLHDAAFDRGLITFDAELRLVLSRELREHVSNSVLAASFSSFEGQALTLPEKFLPDAESLGRHREEVFRV